MIRSVPSRFTTCMNSNNATIESSLTCSHPLKWPQLTTPHNRKQGQRDQLKATSRLLNENLLKLSRLVVCSRIYLFYKSSSEGRAGNKADKGLKVHGKD